MPEQEIQGEPDKRESFKNEFQSLRDRILRDEELTGLLTSTLAGLRKKYSPEQYQNCFLYHWLANGEPSKKDFDLPFDLPEGDLEAFIRGPLAEKAREIDQRKNPAK
jgi:hypothetical protein